MERLWMESCANDCWFLWCEAAECSGDVPELALPAMKVPWLGKRGCCSPYEYRRPR